MPIFLNIEKYFHSRIYTKAMQYWLENICEVYDFGKLRVSCRLQAGSLLLLFNPELHEHICAQSQNVRNMADYEYLYVVTESGMGASSPLTNNGCLLILIVYR